MRYLPRSRAQLRVLVTSSRMPHALDEIRKFGRMGHEVYATDTFRTAPGNRSRYVRRRILTASPTFDTPQFLSDIERAIRTHRIDLVVPSFEESFRIARHIDRFAGLADVFLPPFETLATLHDKFAFAQLCQKLDLAVPETRLATDYESLKEGIGAFDQYLARPAFSRGGVMLLTNAGPLAGKLSVTECDPSPQRPWIVQQFVHGEDVCSFSVAHHGRVVAHCTYVHPKTIEHSGGIYFRSIEDPEALEITRRIVAATNYHGQISFDFLRTPKGLVLVECNPRPTAGVLMMTPSAFVDAVLDPPDGPPHVVPAGVRMQIASAIVRDMFRDWHAIPSDVQAIFSGAVDAYAQAGDLMPGLYQALSYSHVFAFRKHATGPHKHSDLVAAQFYDIAWDGGEIP